MISFLLLIWLLTGLLGSTHASSCHPKNIVDLGYAKHVPTFTNTTKSGHKVNIYQNIRFANPPTGSLRFRNPNTDLPFVPDLQDGKAPYLSRDCIASAPAYVPFSFNGTSWGTEDCLFLDVYVPEGVTEGDDVATLHFLFGGGYAFGGKELLFNPIGLFDRMFEEGGEKFIFVMSNYRLGVSGFTFAEGEDMDPNVGMMDSLAAIEWTKKYIHKFGGDSHRITASGQSAGAGMLYYMMALDGGDRDLPFQQAFISSPAAPPRRNVTSRQRDLFNIVLSSANCTTLDCLRNTPESALIQANSHVISDLPSTGGAGVFGPVIGFGPAPDGVSVRDIPLAEFRRGAVNRGLRRLLLGSMANEGLGLSHDTGLPESFGPTVRQLLPNASEDVVDALRERYGDEEEPRRVVWDWTTDAVFACNDYSLANALEESTMRYIMSVPPATHGEDSSWGFAKLVSTWAYQSMLTGEPDYFYVDQDTTPVSDVGLAKEFQSRLLQFVRGDEMEEWPVYGEDKMLANITADGWIGEEMKAELQANCDAVNGYVLDPANGA